MNPLLEQFLQEARENLSFIDQNIENIGSGDAELLNSVFRAAHTLKGGSGIVGFESVKELTHHAEDLLDMLRSGALAFESSMIDALYDAFDEVMNLIEAAEEREDIVDADEETVQQIIDALNALMGKERVEDESAWSFAYPLIENGSFLRNMSLANLINVPSEALKKTPAVLTQEDLLESKLYVIELDIDPDCMLFGNDPLYALSLLGEKVIGIHTCISKESAKSVLSGIDDADGMKIMSVMYALVYAPFSDIEDALYNFIDDLRFYLPSVQDLLEIELDETFADLALEFASKLQPKIDANDKAGIEEAVLATRSLIAKESALDNALTRIELLLHFCDEPTCSEMQLLLQRLRGESGADESTQTIKEEVTEADELSTNTLPEALLHSVVEQQLQAIEHANSDETLQRVLDVALKLMPHTQQTKPDASQASLESFYKHFFTTDEPTEAVQSEHEMVEAEQPVASHTPETVVPSQEAVSASNASTLKPEQTKPIESATSNTSVSSSKPVEKEVAKSGKVVGKTVKIEQESIDNLMNIVGELLVAKNSLPYLADSIHQLSSEMAKRAIMEKYTFINRLSEQLQDLIMSMRMLPISYVFDRYPKLVREISKDLGKKVSLKMEGGETRLDKNIIEMLADPMIHIMRNSLDHGVELPDVRAAKGKNEQGVISLHAYAQSDKIVIDIIDDGAGINVEKVIKKVIEKELMNIEQIEALSDDEKAQLVLLPGLSTADSISEYSGRGVGMDVVKKSIDSFGGTIHIKTEQNKGTTIKLTIPVSLAVTSLLHVALDGVHYGFPMESVSETVKIETAQIEYLHNLPFVYIREEVIPLIFMDNMLNNEELEGKALPVVVLDVKGNRVAVVVNELLGQLDVVQKPLEGIMEHHPLFSGTALLGNGKIIMIYDPIGVLALQQAFSEEKKAG